MPQVSQGSAVVHQGEKIFKLGRSSWSNDLGGKAKQTSILSVPRQRLSGRGGKFLCPKTSPTSFSPGAVIGLLQLSASLGTKSPELMMGQG